MASGSTGQMFTHRSHAVWACPTVQPVGRIGMCRGVVEVMLDATRNPMQPISERRLCGWHSALFPVGYSGTRPIAVGTWRPVEAGPMQVVSGPIGRERVHFEAPPAEHVSREMARFIEWCYAENGVDPVLRAAVARFWFVTIHPFKDGIGCADLSRT